MGQLACPMPIASLPSPRTLGGHGHGADHPANPACNQRRGPDDGGAGAGAGHRPEARRHADQPADAGTRDPDPRREQPGPVADRAVQDVPKPARVLAHAGTEAAAGKELVRVGRQEDLHVPASGERDVPRRHADDGRRRDLLHHEVPLRPGPARPRRVQQHRLGHRARSAHRHVDSQGAVRAVPADVRRDGRRHRPEARLRPARRRRRQLPQQPGKPEPGRHRAVPVRGMAARQLHPHEAVRRLLEARPTLPGRDRLPHRPGQPKPRTRPADRPGADERLGRHRAVRRAALPRAGQPHG